MFAIVSLLGVLFTAGCAPRETRPAAHQAAERPRVVVVAPVLNLSNSDDWDPLKVTDLVASELQSFPGVFVIPVNRTLAALALMGKDGVATPQDAIDLANEFNADLTLVTAVTEYNPYDPPIIGLLMQWYGPVHENGPKLDPVSASREASEIRPAAAAPCARSALRLQVQRVYNAADQTVLKELRSFADQRAGRRSAYGWRLYTASQELFLRYSCWATIRLSMLLAREPTRLEPPADETEQWTGPDDV
jgi:hypothetical protein